jgi:hypothetical protein
MMSFKTISDQDLLHFAKMYLLEKHLEYFRKVEEAEKAGNTADAAMYDERFWKVQAQLDEVFAAEDNMKEQEVGT